MCAPPHCKREMGPPVAKGNGKTQALFSATESRAIRHCRGKKPGKTYPKAKVFTKPDLEIVLSGKARRLLQ